MNNDINSTGGASNTGNPQGNAVAPGASNAEDFQSTADQEALNSQTGELYVEETGVPIVGSTTEEPASSGLSMGWAIIIVVAAVVAIVVIVKMIKDMISEDRAIDVSNSARAKKAAATRAASKKSTAKKTSNSVSRSGKKKSKKRTTKRK